MSVCNTLILLTDQQDARVLGAAGHSFVRTPHMDSLAERGTRFVNAFTPSPLCVPARACLATGRWLHNIGYWDKATGYDGRVPGWGHALLNAGHRAESIGKFHYAHGAAGTGFGHQHFPLHLDKEIGQVWGSVRNPLPLIAPHPSRMFSEMGPGLSSYNSYDMQSAAEAVHWLHDRAAKPDERPWTLFVGFVAPHFPLVVPQRFLDQVPVDLLPAPRMHPDQGYRRHPWAERFACFANSDLELGTASRRKLALACLLISTES